MLFVMLESQDQILPTAYVPIPTVAVIFLIVPGPHVIIRDLDLSCIARWAAVFIELKKKFLVTPFLHATSIFQ